MKTFFVVFVITYICRIQAYTSLDYEYDEGEEVKFFDLRGTLRLRFGLEAALIKPHKSSICSPISALLPIGKLAFGAEGKTLSELQQAIGVDYDMSYDYDNPSDELISHFKGVLKILKLMPGVILDVANKLYISNRHRIRSRFSKLAKSVFESSVEYVDFSDTQRVLNNINGWVASETHGMIPTILTSNDIDRDSSMVIVNAIYFAGKWKYPFPTVTAGTFYSAKGTREVPMMSHTTHYEYAHSESLNAQVVRIPYQGDKASFILVLPTEKNGLDSVLGTLKSEPILLSWAISSMEKVNVRLTMPKFKIQSEWNLRDLYKKVGISRIFKEGKSELNNIVKNETLVVTAAIQKAVIDVNELGTEAAAVSSAIIFTAGLNYVEMYADHPFLFYIMAKTQQLFVGAYF